MRRVATAWGTLALGVMIGMVLGQPQGLEAGEFETVSGLVAAEGSDGGDDIADHACDGCGCATDCCDGPWWEVTAAALFLHRSRSDSRILVEDATTSEDLLNANEADLDWATGARIGIIRHFDSSTAVEVLYFGIDGWSTSAELTGGNLLIPEFSDSIVFDDLRGQFGSELYSAEINYRRTCCDRVTLLAGFRWIELKEDAFFDGFSEEDYGFAGVDTDNNLYGFQIGAEAVLWEPCQCPFRLDGFLKAGIYGNDVDRDIVAGGVFGDGDFTSDDTRTAFAGEVGITAAYQLTKVISLYAGYEALWVDGVALVLSQGESEELVFGTAFYHGAIAGLKAEW